MSMKKRAEDKCKVEDDKIACSNAALEFSFTSCVPVHRSSASEVSRNALRPFGSCEIQT